MFLRMLRGALIRHRGGRAMIALTTALGACVATAMLGVAFDVGDKVSQELSTYGANIVVQPKGAAVLDDVYGLADAATTGGPALQEAEVANIKTIFWAFNITQFAPFLEVAAQVGASGEASMADAAPVTVVGSWFAHQLALPTGEHVSAGLIELRAWWEVAGGWIADGDVGLAMVGSKLAQERGLGLGDWLALTGPAGQAVDVQVAGLYTAGGDEDGQVLVPLAVAQQLAGRPGEVDRVEVAALTTPDNDLARRAAQNPGALTVSEWETWYCTAYASSIAYQIEEVMTDAVAKPVREVTEAQGTILTKTGMIMILVTLLSLLASALGVANLVTASVMERAPQIGLMKAVGAPDGAVVRLILAEMAVIGLAGGVVGFGLGLGAAQVVGFAVFGGAITPRPVVAALVALLVVLVMVGGSLPAIRLLVRLRPAEVLHGR
ncbi:MAG: ABC transporter permease [Bifidobacteriaceae bacterium]|nr:ABC transporter permease [Bifidobacteriaceae bacterium]